MESKGVIVAFDLGTKTGFCVMEPDGKLVETGTWKLTPKFGEDFGVRFSKFRKLVESLLGDYNVLGVVFEEVNFFKAAYAAQIYGGFQAFLTSICNDAGVPCSSVAVQTLKKFAGAKGSKKEALKAALDSRHPGISQRVGKDDNAVDAAWLALYLVENGRKNDDG